MNQNIETLLTSLNKKKAKLLHSSYYQDFNGEFHIIEYDDSTDDSVFSSNEENYDFSNDIENFEKLDKEFNDLLLNC